MVEPRVTGKTKFAILECKKFQEHLFLSRQSIAASLVCDFFKVKSTKGKNRLNCFLPPAESIGVSSYFGSYSFLVIGKLTR